MIVRALTRRHGRAADRHRGDGAGRWQHRAPLAADFDAVLAIEVQSYSHPWTLGHFKDSLGAGYRMELRLNGDGELVGYSVVMPGVKEAHLLNLTVAPSARRQGHARALLDRAVHRARAHGERTLWLEVRSGNQEARALYHAYGFTQRGLRPGYYPIDHQQREDALVLALDLPDVGHPASTAGFVHGVD